MHDNANLIAVFPVGRGDRQYRVEELHLVDSELHPVKGRFAVIEVDEWGDRKRVTDPWLDARYAIADALVLAGWEGMALCFDDPEVKGPAPAYMGEEVK